MMIIPIAEPVIGEEEKALVLEGLASGWISSIGKYIKEFEENFAEYCQVKYGITTSNGTTALHLAVIAADIGPGDEVIIPSLTFVATANAVKYVGGKPIFVDSEMDTWNIDPEKVKEKITRRTKAIIPVHLYGHPVNMEIILSIARKYGIKIIEDAAESHGAEYRGRKVGGLGDMACFSFFGNKIITTGEGGMIVTNNKSLAEKIRMLRDHGMSKRRKYYYPKIGFNYRMTNLQAALGVAQLRKIDFILQRKKEIAFSYNKHLRFLVPDVILPPEKSWAKNVFWMYSLTLNNKKGIKRDVLMKRLKEKGIDSRPFFFPIHKLPQYRSGENLPVAEFLAENGLNLPSSINLSDEKIKYICDTIISTLRP